MAVALGPSGSFGRVRLPKMALAIALTLLAAVGCKHGDGSLPLQVEISHGVGEQPLGLGKEYTLAGGERVSVSKLRYYLSNFRLRRRDGSWSAAARSDQDARGYFLVDESQPASRSFDVAGFKAGDYEGIEFLIGVDAQRNAAGVQSGALDPAHGMFWTWNTGYIFFKLEGRSPDSAEDGQAVIYHVGGSRQPADNSRRIYLPLAPRPLKLQPGLKTTVHLQADLARIFQGPPALRIAEHASVMDVAGGKLVADNLAGVFRIDHVHHEPLH